MQVSKSLRKTILCFNGVDLSLKKIILKNPNRTQKVIRIIISHVAVTAIVNNPGTFSPWSKQYL